MKRIYTLREKIKVMSFILLFFVAFSYGVSRAYPLISGSKIVINYPKDGDTVSAGTFQVSGQAIRAKEIKIQGKPVTVDNQGNFNETLVSSHPYTVIVLEATDKYDGTVVKTLRVIPSQ